MATTKKTATASAKPAAKAEATKTTAVATRASGAVVSLREQLAKQVADLNSRVAPASGITIGITQAKEFKFPDGTKSKEFEGVIVDFVSTSFFYENTYDPNNIVSPACFAIGTNPLQLVPSDNAPVKQSDSCKGCPMNEFGSAGKGKACKNGRLLAVLPPDADAETPVWLLKVSPTGIKAFDSHVRSVATTFQLPPVGVVTTFSFDEGSDFASVRFGNPVMNDNLEAHYARQEEAQRLLTAEPDVSGYEAPAQTAKAAPKKGAFRR